MLELFYFRGRYILGAADAVYSDGDRYRPLVAACKSPALAPYLPRVREVLVLGTGLASAVHVLKRYGHHPGFTLVEIDPLVLEWAMEFLPEGASERIRPVCADARVFMEDQTGRYDLIIVDVFFGRNVPGFVTDAEFVWRCRARLQPGGRLVLNYMINREEEDTKAKAALEAAFGTVTEISFGINKVYVASM